MYALRIVFLDTILCCRNAFINYYYYYNCAVHSNILCNHRVFLLMSVCEYVMIIARPAGWVYPCGVSKRFMLQFSETL